MVELEFEVEGVEVEKYSASPMLRFVLRVANKTPTLIVKNILLGCQIRIEPARRGYNTNERERLVELFGASQQWGEALRGLLWTHANVAVPAFENETRVHLPAPCTRDFNIASAKYFNGLLDGEAPLTFLFSGSVFYSEVDGPLQIQQISWSKEEVYRLPVSVWQSLMDLHYPDSDWLRLDRDTFERLYQFKRRWGHLTFDAALNDLLEVREKEIAS
jgi:hypothetical protein